MGYHIEELSYEQVKPLLNQDTIIVLPIGGAVEHAAHLPMGTDEYIAQYLADRLTERCDVITLPILSYAFYPKFVDWKGTASVSARVFTDTVKDICISFARHGVKKFLVIDASLSSKYPLYTVATEMNNEWHAKVAISLEGLGHRSRAELLKTPVLDHAGESETSVMLHIRPDLVHMDKAVDERQPGLDKARVNGYPAVYYSKRIHTAGGGDGTPTLADAEKGRLLLEDMMDDLVYFTENFRRFEITTY